MRLDRLLTLGVSRPLHRADNGQGGRHLPILMYHSISDYPETKVHPYFKVCTAPKRFAEQMRWLKEAGWRGVTLTAGLAALRSSDPNSPGRSTADPAHPEDPAPPGKIVAITFDDGFRDFYSDAAPVLKQHGHSATMYLASSFVGEQRRARESREYLTWQEVRELHAAGMEFGSHTVSHPKLIELDWPEIETEVRDSRTQLEQNLGVAIRHFAYPYAFPTAERKFTPRFLDLLRTAGYETNVTTAIGRATAKTDPMVLPRLPANSDDDRALFEAKLSGSYDWLAGPQAWKKWASRLVRRRTRHT